MACIDLICLMPSGKQHDAEDDREDDDREAEVAGEVVEPGEQPADRVEQRLERPDLSEHGSDPASSCRSIALCMAVSYVEWDERSRGLVATAWWDGIEPTSPEWVAPKHTPDHQE